MNEFAAKWIGREIDARYRILELLAEGSMGAVFVAEHLTLAKRVALKMIRDDCAIGTVTAKRFTREALTTARIDHPHVAGAIDFGRLPDGGGSYLVTQLVGGESLGRRLARGPLPWAEACLLGSQVADALVAAHAVGVVHRDLKPENIVLEPRSGAALHARVVDFGIAHVPAGPHPDAPPLSRNGTVLGTPGYMAPEQTIGAEIDCRADLYALGVILWECCAGRFLWGTTTLTELRAFQMSLPAPSLREACSGKVPEALAALVERLLARNAHDRPASAAVVRGELRELALRGELGDSVGMPAMVGSRPAANWPAGAVHGDDASHTTGRPSLLSWLAVTMLAVTMLVLLMT